MRVFSASEHVGSILLATSMRYQHFSLILNTVFGRNVPTSSSCIVVNTLAMVDRGTLTSHRRVVNLSSLWDMSFSARVTAITSSLGWCLWSKQLPWLWRYQWFEPLRYTQNFIGHSSSQVGARLVMKRLALAWQAFSEWCFLLIIFFFTISLFLILKPWHQFLFVSKEYL